MKISENHRNMNEKSNRKKSLSNLFVVPMKIDQQARKGFPLAFLLFLFLYCLNVTLAKSKY